MLRDGAQPGARNMARDHALALTLRDGHAVLRLYAWERPTMSLGRNEPSAGYSRDVAARLGVDIVRRPTGGRAVLHWRELTYAVVASARALGGPRAAYRWIHARIADGLRELGAPVALAGEPQGRATAVDAGPCFQATVGGEVVAHGRKLVGSAQRCFGDTLLQHGSILLEDDQDMLLELRGGGVPSDANRPATLGGLIGTTDRATVEGTLLDAFADAVGELADAGSLEAASEAELESQYRSDAWTSRR